MKLIFSGLLLTNFLLSVICLMLFQDSNTQVLPKVNCLEEKKEVRNALGNVEINLK